MENENVLIQSQLNNSGKFVAGYIIAVGAVSTVVSTSQIKDDETRTLVFLCGLGIIIIGIVTLFFVSNCSLTVTDKRVIGKVASGKQVDLPLRQISAVSKVGGSKLSVHTSSGHISFSMLKNRDAIYDILTKLIYEMQEQQSVPAVSVVQQSSDADELAKYKALLDGGAITQEEYDAKKKQILGL